jgi:hypothetical protein
LVDHAARAGAIAVFRYLATNTDKFSNSTMSAAFAGGVLEIIRLVEAKMSFSSVTAVEAAGWAADAVHRWNFEVAEWLLRERPDVFMDAGASRVLWLAAAKARDLATLRTLQVPESRSTMSAPISSHCFAIRGERIYQLLAASLRGPSCPTMSRYSLS